MFEKEKQILDALSISLPKLSVLDTAIFLGFAEGLAFKTKQEEAQERLAAQESA